MKTCEGYWRPKSYKKKRKRAQVIKTEEGFLTPLVLLVEEGGSYLKRFNIALAKTVHEQ